jgi:hypothetical protein
MASHRKLSRLKQRFETPQIICDKTSQFKHIETPTHSAVLGVVWYNQQYGIPYILEDLEKTFSLAKNTIKRLPKDKQPRRQGHRPDQGPDPRGSHRRFTRSMTATTDGYLHECGYERRGDPWKEITFQAGIEEEFSERTIRRHMLEGEDTITAVAAKKELPERVITMRIEWIGNALGRHDWIRVCFCDELHFSLGQRAVRRIK